MEWVATRGGNVRHPVNTSFEGEAVKALLCRERPLVVHVCSNEEMDVLRPCWRCRQKIDEDAMKNELIKLI